MCKSIKVVLNKVTRRYLGPFLDVVLVSVKSVITLALLQPDYIPQRRRFAFFIRRLSVAANAISSPLQTKKLGKMASSSAACDG